MTRVKALQLALALSVLVGVLFVPTIASAASPRNTRLVIVTNNWGEVLIVKVSSVSPQPVSMRCLTGTCYGEVQVPAGAHEIQAFSPDGQLVASLTTQVGTPRTVVRMSIPGTKVVHSPCFQMGVGHVRMIPMCNIGCYGIWNGDTLVCTPNDPGNPPIGGCLFGAASFMDTCP